MKVVAIVGMAGAGKSEVARLFEASGFIRIRFGEITDKEIKKRGLELSEENERRVRELLRQDYGMAAYAMLNLSRIDLALKNSAVVIDGLYSWEEYTLLRSYYGQNLRIVAVWAPPETRYARLAAREERPLIAEEAAGRDKAEIEKINKGGPIAIADYTILNESSLKNMEREAKRTIAALWRRD